MNASLESAPQLNSKEALINEAIAVFSEKVTKGFTSLNDIQGEMLSVATHICGDEKKATALGYGDLEKVFWAHDGTWITLPGNNERPLIQSDDSVTFSDFDEAAFKQALLNDERLVS